MNGSEMATGQWYVAALVGGAIGATIGALSLHTARVKGAAIGSIIGAGFGMSIRGVIRFELAQGGSSS